jgi:DNA polymerase-1
MDHKDLLKLLEGIQETEETTPQKNEDRVLIIDGLNLFLRNFAVLNYINQDGVHIGGLGGFLRSLGSLVKQIQPTSIYVIFDGIGSTINRKNLVPEYKSNRNLKQINKVIFTDNEDENESKSDQISRLIQYLKCLPIKIISLDKVEADDVIAFLSVESTKNKTTKAYIVSSDKDFLQLVDDNITVYAAMEKNFYTPKAVKEKYGIHPFNFLTYKSLMGDGSDKIAGVKGLGAKKLPKMFPELFGDQSINLEDIFEICEAKYDKHVIYSRIIFDFDKLKNNQKIMNLGNPMLDDREKEHILNLVKKSPYKLDIVSFVKMYHEDGLGHTLPNANFWLRDTFRTLSSFK